jgi:hypothetical protein
MLEPIATQRLPAPGNDFFRSPPRGCGSARNRECTDSCDEAQRIQRTINRAAGPRFARCTAPIRLRPADLSGANQDPRYGLELRIEPLEMMTDFRHEPGRKIAVRLREWAALLERAVASLE